MSKASDKRLTPTATLEAARHMAGGPIALDPCTEKSNPAGALVHYARPQNGLDHDWARVAVEAARVHDVARPLVLVNPPFSDRLVWDMAAAFHGNRGLCDVLVYCAVDTSAAWWRTLERSASLRCEYRERQRCVDPATGKQMDVARACAAFHFGPSEFEFRKAFGRLGGIVKPGDVDIAELEDLLIIDAEFQEAAPHAAE